jgi:hypothetical protein
MTVFLTLRGRLDCELLDESTLGRLLTGIACRSTECLGLHLGGPFSANLGDGNGPVNQTVELREDFGNILLGTCLESAAGGNHLRMFRQNGPTANTGALFLACVGPVSFLLLYCLLSC